MLDFTVTKSDFAQAIEQITQGRPDTPGKRLDVLCATPEITLVLTGRRVTCASQVTDTAAQ